MDTVESISPVAILGHGASGTAASMGPWVEALASHGLAALAVDLPRGRAEKAAPVFDQAVPLAHLTRSNAGIWREFGRSRPATPSPIPFASSGPTT